MSRPRCGKYDTSSLRSRATDAHYRPEFCVCAYPTGRRLRAATVAEYELGKSIQGNVPIGVWWDGQSCGLAYVQGEPSEAEWQAHYDGSAFVELAYWPTQHALAEVP